MANTVNLEWDETKREATLRERGIDFASVSQINWSLALTIEQQHGDELRYVTVAPIHDRLHVLAWCYRGTNLRVISLRKANQREVKQYEQELHG